MSLEELFSMAKSVMRRFSLYIKWTASGKHYKWLPITIKEPKKYFLKLSLLFKPNTPVQWWPMNSNERKFTFKRENKKIVTVMHPTRFKSGLYLLYQINWCYFLKINIQFNCEVNLKENEGIMNVLFQSMSDISNIALILLL